MNYTCPKNPEDLCDCAARVSEEAEELLHVLQNLTDGRWELDYTTLSEPEPRTLRVEGTCARCGKTICACFQVEELAKEPLLDKICILMRCFYHHAEEKPDMERFYDMFSAMFREADRELVAGWLAERRLLDKVNGRRIYTIIRTACNADRGYFPDPTQEGSFLSEARAKEELARLISLAQADPAFETCNQEERGETWWEKSEDGYAAAHYTRLEIVESELNA